MAKNTSITLSDHFEAYIGEQVAAGRYGSASEVVRAGLRILEVSDARINALRSALNEGEQSGFVNYDYDRFIATLDAGE
ncbi:MAG: type II toxin-antitoxin system ParD family antitoxin [Salinisphaera sp.]|nr:type II toxin-antitoxin system ParD family antitoxin [Salinisphaera sp.]